MRRWRRRRTQGLPEVRRHATERGGKKSILSRPIRRVRATSDYILRAWFASFLIVLHSIEFSWRCYAAMAVRWKLAQSFEVDVDEYVSHVEPACYNHGDYAWQSALPYLAGCAYEDDGGAGEGSPELAPMLPPSGLASLDVDELLIIFPSITGQAVGCPLGQVQVDCSRSPKWVSTGTTQTAKFGGDAADLS